MSGCLGRESTVSFSHQHLPRVCVRERVRESECVIMLRSTVELG